MKLARAVRSTDEEEHTVRCPQAIQKVQSSRRNTPSFSHGADARPRGRSILPTDQQQLRLLSSENAMRLDETCQIIVYHLA